MPRVHFTSNIQRHVECPTTEANGESLQIVLDSVFALIPRVKEYVLDDQGHLRKHMVIFIDGNKLKDGSNFDIPVNPESEIYIMQALSGG